MTRSKRILFLRPPALQHVFETPKPFFQGMIPRAGDTVGSLWPAHRMTGSNSGNLIHVESMTRILDYSADGSASISLHTVLRKRSMDWLVDAVNANFDVLVFSCANFIRPETDFSKEYAFLCRLTIPRIIVGAGIQHSDDGGELVISDSVRKVIDLADAEFEIFGVRGDITAEILAGRGARNVTSLGCPSFYAFPRNMSSFGGIPQDGPSRVLCAGYMARNAGGGARFSALMEIINCLTPGAAMSYVFQNELFWKEDGLYEENSYDQVRKEVSRDWVARQFFGGNIPEPGLRSFHYFDDTASWRLFAAGHDIYIGDRIHGGVIAMQAGRPAVIVYKDLRVRELAEKISLPGVDMRAPVDEALRGRLHEALSPAGLRRFRTTYTEAYNTFMDTLDKAGLKTVLPRRLDLPA
ncbi:polysaccharide pyruvyl transferase family protein (plasmid) [Paroceanicella profunda]|uniref:Polysaccharide pyruvyl transferase family protein n=1 Tax=Paroceanicella profunda TaxID=2579971 RepID=A0A5B8FJS3_9RHOB|nr:polysaccharide pyruvyl transferase family protein [Paroceanicella profunda]QDL94698.1 polysaccharide pyruvyl transferase family protein [Paroceanicella profunda]